MREDFKGINSSPLSLWSLTQSLPLLGDHVKSLVAWLGF